jgi:hypothetical protein
MLELLFWHGVAGMEWQALPAASRESLPYFCCAISHCFQLLLLPP